MELTAWHRPCQDPRGAVALVHGAGEHCGRYEHVADHLNRAGYAVLGLDLPGLGRSPGRRGHVESFEDYLGAVDATRARLEALHPGVPQFLYGHSMGGLIAVRWLQSRAPAAQAGLGGAILSCPCLDLALPLPPALLRTAALIERVWPTFTQSNRIPASAVSRTPEVVAAYAHDPLVVRSVSVRWAMELQRAMLAARAGPARAEVPVLVLQAGADQLVSAAATRAYAERLEAPRKLYREFPGWYHELHNEPGRDEVLALLTGFLDETLAVAR